MKKDLKRKEAEPKFKFDPDVCDENAKSKYQKQITKEVLYTNNIKKHY